MEMDTQPGGGYQYGQNMLKQKQEMAQKKMELSAQMQANLLVDGWGLWLQCKSGPQLKTNASYRPRHGRILHLHHKGSQV